MKNVLIVLLTICLVMGVSGCMQNSSEEDNQQKIDDMLSYINSKYDENFEAVEYIPGEEGFNDFTNQNTLIAKNNLGITILVTEFLGKKGEYQDNYRNMLASYLFKKELGIEDLSYITNSKFYVSGNIQDTDGVDVNDLKNNFNDYITSLNSINTFIYINEPLESVNLEEIYNLYSKINSYNFDVNTFSLGFEGDINKSSEYLEKYRYLGKLKRWNEYDESLTAYMRLLQETNLTFEEFKKRLYEGIND
ncbi:hypothetical protein H9636_09560 [Ureibacillus sp. Re31]|uniref:Uncharacterized protein n=1 Tax=Ureibacillus galli TaxID=2762222 RepID=A0ABR8XCD7_9BACL|nr:hypothetical protein [Ureibacillus galli]MBD8026906.1 hypothetical protein [Ureibacillus galli]